MGAIGGLLGTAGGAGGSGFSGPHAAAITPGTTAAQIQQSRDSVLNAQNQQQQLLTALQGQQGLTQQTNLTGAEDTLQRQLAKNNGAANVGSAYTQTQNLANQLAKSNGVGNLSAALASQQALAAQQQGTAAQYQNIANGTGPNPAMAALNQQTGNNIAQQASLMAGQRGAASNVGLIARQAAQQGAGVQQQAVGQGATMQAQQSLNALSGLSSQQQAIGQTQQNVANIAGQQVGMTQAQQQALAAQAQAQVAQQQSQYAQLGNQINTVAGQQIGATTANTQAQQSEQGIVQGALSNQNQANVSMQGNINSANAGLATTNMQGQQGLIGGVMGGVGSALGLAHGGIAKMADGGIPPNASAVPMAPPVPAVPPTPMASAAPVQTPLDSNSQGPQSSYGKFLKGFAGSMASNAGAGNAFANMNDMTPSTGAQALNKGLSSAIQGGVQKFKGSNMQAPTSIGTYAGSDAESAPSQMSASKGGMAKRHDYRTGGTVQARNEREKAVKKGDSYSNDKIPAVLSEEEIVIPRSVTQGSDPVRGSADFVAKVLAKRGRK